MARPRSAAREATASLILTVLPEAGQPPLSTTRIAQALPLTIAQVSDGIQRLRVDGLAVNPGGPKTSSWTKAPVDSEPAPVPDAPADEDTARTLARIEGTLAGLAATVRAIADDLGIDH